MDSLKCSVCDWCGKTIQCDDRWCKNGMDFCDECVKLSTKTFKRSTKMDSLKCSVCRVEIVRDSKDHDHAHIKNGEITCEDCYEDNTICDWCGKTIQCDGDDYWCMDGMDFCDGCGTLYNRIYDEDEDKQFKLLMKSIKLFKKK